MSLVKFNRPFLSNWDTMFDGFLDDDRFLRNKAYIPAANIEETDEAYLITLAIPGKKKEDIQVEVVDNILNISSENEETVEDKEKNYSRKEYNYSSFKRSFTLPEHVKGEKIEANYENGELILSLPKAEITTSKSKLIQVG